MKKQRKSKKCAFCHRISVVKCDLTEKCRDLPRCGIHATIHLITEHNYQPSDPAIWDVLYEENGFKTNPAEEELLEEKIEKTMLSLEFIRHPDKPGHWVDPYSGLTLRHRKLKIWARESPNFLKRVLDEIGRILGMKETMRETIQIPLKLTLLAKLLIKAAQKTYDEWEQDEEGFDEELGIGGICQNIAEAFCDVLSSQKIECGLISSQVGEQHVWTLAKLEDGVYEIDIDPRIYERGGGYHWEKIPGIKFNLNNLIISKLDLDPKNFEKYLDIL